MTIDVLGTTYNICFDTIDKDNLGECDRYDKIIRLNLVYFQEPENNFKAIYQTLKHEILHAFFHEAGLDCYAEDETLCDALAVLMDKAYMAIVDAIQIIIDNTRE